MLRICNGISTATMLTRTVHQSLGFCDRASWANCEVREKINKIQQLDVYYQYFLNMFRAPICPSSGEQDVCYCTLWAALVLLDVVGRGCGALRCGVRALWRLLLAPYNAAPHNRYQPHPAEPAQHTTCSNTRLVLPKMGIMMPETCWEIVKNKHLTVASCWFSLSLHNLLTMHGHRNLKQFTFISTAISLLFPRTLYHRLSHISDLRTSCLILCWKNPCSVSTVVV